MPLSVKKNFSQVWSTTDFTIHIRTNSVGLREDFELPPGKVDVGFLGDSFTFEQGVEAGQRYSDRLRDLLGDRLVASSYAYLDGWSPPHDYLFLCEHPELIPRLAILGLCLANDLTIDMADAELTVSDTGKLLRVRSRSREVDPLGRLISIDQNPWNHVLRDFWFGRLLLHLDQHLALGLPRLAVMPTDPLRYEDMIDSGLLSDPSRIALEYVAKTARLVRDNGGSLVVFLIPLAGYVGPYQHLFAPELSEDVRTHRYLTKALQKWCGEHDIPCIDPIADFRAMEEKENVCPFLTIRTGRRQDIWGQRRSSGGRSRAGPSSNCGEIPACQTAQMAFARRPGGGKGGVDSPRPPQYGTNR